MSRPAPVRVDAVDAVEHAVGVEEQRRVVRDRLRDRGTLGAVRIEAELAAFAVVEPRHAGGDRHAPRVEEPGVVHRDEQPLRHHLAIAAAELGHVGVHRQLLAGHHQVGEHDGRLDHRPAVHLAGGVGEALVEEVRLDARR